MILCGVDLVKIDRFNELIKNDKFLRNNFNMVELDYINKCNNSISTIAGIYAAKEAALKALKKGINNYSLKDIIIDHEDSGAPIIMFQGRLESDFHINSTSLSISHDGEYAIAIVLIIN